MKKQLPIRCKIRDDLIKNEITWIEIDEADGGYYMFQYLFVF